MTSGNDEVIKTIKVTGTEGIYADSGLKKLKEDYGMKVEFGEGKRTFQLNTEVATNTVELKLNDQLIAKFLPSDIQYLGKMFTQFHQQVFEPLYRE